MIERMSHLESKSCVETRSPLKVVKDGPAKCSCHIDTIVMNGRKDVVEV